ncbi:MAG: hypothetical protein ACI4RH_13470 [Huintestinicola sp.]
MAKTAYERNKNSIKKYLSEKTDDIRIRVPKGKKEEYKAFAAKHGISLTGLICELLERAMDDKDFDPVLKPPIEEGDLEGYQLVNLNIR